MSNPKVMAYRRENGRFGIRNHVLTKLYESG
jgi:altronate dehydratase